MQSTRSDTDTGYQARRQAYQCQRKRHALEAPEAEMRRGYKASREVSLRRRQQKYRDYLSAFCR